MLCIVIVQTKTELRSNKSMCTQNVNIKSNILFYLGTFFHLLIIFQSIIIIWLLSFNAIRSSCFHHSTVGTGWTFDRITSCIEKRMSTRTSFTGNRYLIIREAVKFIDNIFNLAYNLQTINLINISKGRYKIFQGTKYIKSLK